VRILPRAPDPPGTENGPETTTCDQAVS